MLYRVRIFIDGELVYEEEKEIEPAESESASSTEEGSGGGQ